MTSEQRPGLIYEAIAKVQAEIGEKGIAKDRENQAQRFRFRGVDDVMNALNPIMSKHGVFFVPMCEERIAGERATKNGTMVAVAVKMRWRFYAKDGSYVEGCTYGEAFDSGDKATNKGMAAALKYAFFDVFCIPTEGQGDDDADAQSHKIEKTAEKPKERKLVEGFELVEDALSALMQTKSQQDVEEWTVRVKASIANNKFSKEEIARLQAAKQSRVGEVVK